MSLKGKIYLDFCKTIEQGTFLWDFLVYVYKSKGRTSRSELLKKNKQFKDIHQGERCFILGNGPSLSKIDFSLLENEQVFTVNCLMENENFFKLKSNYHFWMDLNGFGLRNDVKTDNNLYIEMMHKLEKCNNLVFFVPVQAYEVIKKTELDKKINIKYLDYFRWYNQINKIDISKISLEFSTVVQYAIETAIYMGFKEIYLLGCDTTIIKSVIEIALGEKMSVMHAYDEDDNDTQEKAFKQILKNSGLKSELKDTLRVLEGYEKLYEYCEAKGIKLVNLSEVTLIDSLPRNSLSRIL